MYNKIDIYIKKLQKRCEIVETWKLVFIYLDLYLI